MNQNSWSDILKVSYEAMESEYRDFLEKDFGYFPNQDNYLNAFKTLPKDKVKYILFGQDPYPREESAGGYAFIDMKVKNIFSSTGLSKEVNRATSLRNFFKMLFVANGTLKADTTQDAIKEIDSSNYIETIDELRLNFEQEGVLLLNTALIFTRKEDSKYHVKMWRPFMQKLLEQLESLDIELILFGTHAKELEKRFDLSRFNIIRMEHPYNNSFIFNKDAIKLFGSMNLLEK